MNIPQFRAKDKQGFWRKGDYFSSYDTHYIRTFNEIPPTYAEPGGDYQEIDYEIDVKTLGLRLDVEVNKIRVGEYDLHYNYAHDGDIVRYKGKRYELRYEGFQWQLDHIDGDDNAVIIDEDVAWEMKVVGNEYDK